jgi:cell division protein FtsB
MAKAPARKSPSPARKGGKSSGRPVRVRKAGRRRMLPTRRVVINLVLFGLLAMFGARLVFGDHGLLRLFRLEHEKADLSQDLESATRERYQMEDKASRLRDDSLDLDMLEEQAKKQLNYRHPDEKIVPTSPKEQAR